MADRHNKIAIIALIVSISTACFSVYQWHDSHHEVQVVTAIDISRKFVAEDGRLFFEAGAALLGNKQITSEQATLIYRELRQAEYHAYLINRGRIDPDYLSSQIRCGIYSFNKVAEKFKLISSYADTFPEIARFSKEINAECDPYYQQFIKWINHSN